MNKLKPFKKVSLIVVQNILVRYTSSNYGKVAEWFKAHAWNACMGATSSWVRIPPFPPEREPDLRNFRASHVITITLLLREIPNLRTSLFSSLVALACFTGVKLAALIG